VLWESSKLADLLDSKRVSKETMRRRRSQMRIPCALFEGDVLLGTESPRPVQCDRLWEEELGIAAARNG
jgi:hypothetical protein